MSDVVVGLPIEKSSKEIISVCEYDFKIQYFPVSDNCAVPYKPNREDAGYIILLKIKKFCQKTMLSFHSI